MGRACGVGPGAGSFDVPMEADEYIKLADLEDDIWYFRAAHAHVRRELLAHVPVSRPAKMLDAGCGTGGLVKRFAPLSPHWSWSGIDFMPQACELALRRCPGCDIRQASVLQLPFEDASFDVVISMDVMCQLSHPDESDRALFEFARVLSPGGLLILNAPAYKWMWSYHDVACQSRHRYSRREFREQILKASFRLNRLTHWNALPFPLVLIKRKVFAGPIGSSDLRMQSAVVETVMRGVMGVERAWLHLGGRFAWGTSLFAAATKI